MSLLLDITKISNISMLSRLGWLAVLIISSINFLSVVSTLQNISSAVFPSKPLFLQFSKNQKYLACGSEMQVDIYDGITLDHVQSFPLK